MCVCVVCMYVYVLMYTCIDLCMYMQACMYISVYAYTYVCMYICMYACMYVCMYCMHACECACMHVCDAFGTFRVRTLPSATYNCLCVKAPRASVKFAFMTASLPSSIMYDILMYVPMLGCMHLSIFVVAHMHVFMGSYALHACMHA